MQERCHEELQPKPSQLTMEILKEKRHLNAPKRLILS
jgi:hypothetical protein